MRKIAMYAAALAGSLAAVTTAAAFAYYFIAREPAPDGPIPHSAGERSGVATGGVEMASARLDDLREAQGYPSVSAAVFVRGELVWSEAAGYADLQAETPATPATRYVIGSVSKAVTATAAMALAERGRIDLDAPIKTYAPELPDAYDAVTLRHLLSHQAGVRHYRLRLSPPTFTEFGLNRSFASIEDALDLFIDDPLEFAPDEGFRYSTFGYTLVAHILERATGQPLGEIFEEMAYAPAGLTTIGFDDSKDGVASGYFNVAGSLFAAPDTDSSFKRGGGGLASTPTDVARFGAAVLRGAIVTPAGFEEMTTPRTTAGGEINEQQYGLGWRRAGFVHPHGSEYVVRLVYHGGTSVGWECALALVPAHDISVALCGNAYTGGSGDMRNAAAGIARGFIGESVASG